MYSYYIIINKGSSSDEIANCGIAHVVEHFIALSLIQDCFDGNVNNLRGEVSFSYTMICWSDDDYAKGYKITTGFSGYLKSILDNFDIYRCLAEIAILEVKDEVMFGTNKTTSFDKMIRVLSFNKCKSGPIGLIEDIEKIHLSAIYAKIKEYGYEKLIQYFIFDHSSDVYVLMHKHHLHNKNRTRAITDTLQPNNTYINCIGYVFFNQGLIRIALPQYDIGINFCLGSEANHSILNVLFTMCMCSFVDKYFLPLRPCQYESITLNKTNQYDLLIFGITPCSQETLIQIVEDMTIDRSAFVKTLLDSIDYEQIITEFWEYLDICNVTHINRGDCRDAILNSLLNGDNTSFMKYEQFIRIKKHITKSELINYITKKWESIDKIFVFF